MAHPVRRNDPFREYETQGGDDPLPPREPLGAPRPSNDPVKDQARELLTELTAAFRERQQYGSGGGTRSPSGVAVERIKLLANFFNTVAAGLLTAGLIGPMAAYLYGFTASARTTLELAEGVMVVFLLSVLSHLAGRAVLGRLAK